MGISVLWIWADDGCDPENAFTIEDDWDATLVELHRFAQGFPAGTVVRAESYALGKVAEEVSCKPVV
jgi:hypothetical protein